MNEFTTVYVVATEDRLSAKIGTTRNMEKRFFDLQTACPQRLILLHLLPGGRKIESFLHKVLSSHASRGEWFAGGSSLFLHDLAEAIPAAKNLYRSYVEFGVPV